MIFFDLKYNDLINKDTYKVNNINCLYFDKQSNDLSVKIGSIHKYNGNIFSNQRIIAMFEDVKLFIDTFGKTIYNYKENFKLDFKTPPNYIESVILIIDYINSIIEVIYIGCNYNWSINFLNILNNPIANLLNDNYESILFDLGCVYKVLTSFIKELLNDEISSFDVDLLLENVIENNNFEILKSVIYGMM